MTRRIDTLLQQLFYLAIAGALGALARYGLAGAAERLYGTDFPWGTLFVNALGCLLFGVIWSLADERFVINPEIRVIVLTGFMGAFTTFSTFIFETGRLLQTAQFLLAAGNLAAQLVTGLIFLYLGSTIARIL